MKISNCSCVLLLAATLCIQAATNEANLSDLSELDSQAGDPMDSNPPTKADDPMDSNPPTKAECGTTFRSLPATCTILSKMECAVLRSQYNAKCGAFNMEDGNVTEDDKGVEHSVSEAASCARKSGSRIEAWSSCAVQLIGEEGTAPPEKEVGAPTDLGAEVTQDVEYVVVSGNAVVLRTASLAAAQNELAGATTGSRMICVSTDGVIEADPHQQPPGQGAGLPNFNKYWNNWGDINRMNAIAQAEVSKPVPSPSNAPSNAAPCDYHPGLAYKSWMEPYRKAILDAHLRNVTHNGVQLDCNPASCDNPSVCGIPTCTGIVRYSTDYYKAVTKSRCPAQGCGVEEEIVSSNMPFKPTWNHLIMSQPATRGGYLSPTSHTPGFVKCFPFTNSRDSGGNTGSWLWPGAGNCNPYDLLACSKGSIAHTGLPPQADNSHMHSAVLFVKTTWCIKGECDSSNCPTRCYSFKEGQCLKFTRVEPPVMPKHGSWLTPEHTKDAFKELKAGKFSTDCTNEAAMAARGVMAAN